MGTIDDITALVPMHYRVVRVCFQVVPGKDLQTFWNVRILNADGRELQVVHPVSQPDTPLRDALIDWHADSTTLFKTATGLTEWVEP